MSKLATAMVRTVAVLVKAGDYSLPIPAAVAAAAAARDVSLSVGETAAAVGPCDAICWVPGIPASELSRCFAENPECKWVHCYSAGVDSLRTFLPEVAARDGAALTNGRGAFSSSLAEYALACILHFNKQVPRWQANGSTQNWDPFRMKVVKGQTLGLVGYGDIAQATAKLARAFGMRVIATRRDPSKADGADLDAAYGNSPEARLEVFRQADHVVCSLPDAAGTKDFCGAAEFAAMKPTATFVSIGRGAAVDEAALAQALREDAIAGAALDVFKTEPLPETDPLWGLAAEGKLLVTAHNADRTDDYFELGWAVWLKNLEAIMDGKAPATVVDPGKGY